MDLSPTVVEIRTAWLLRLLRCTGLRAVILETARVECVALDGTPAGEPFAYEDLAPVEITCGRFTGSIVLADISGRRLRVTGLWNRAAERIAIGLTARVSLQGSRERLGSLVEWAGSHAALISGHRFISRHEHARWVDTWAETAAWEACHRDAIREALPHLAAHLHDTTRFWVDQEGDVQRANEAFVTAETARHAALFDDVNGRSLTSQQRAIAVRNDTDLLVVAGAGTGKTQAIAGKVAYLVRAGLARPEEILIVAFNTKAAEELRERAGRAGGEGVQARTFHSLGHMILGAPALLDEAGDEAAMLALLRDLIEQLRNDPKYESALAELILLHRDPLTPTVSCGDFQGYAQSVKASSLRPYQGGPRVRHGEELRIADWLFLHGVEYEYERIYPASGGGASMRPIPAAQPTSAQPTPAQPPPALPPPPRPYRPAFYLPSWGIWLSHYPLDPKGEPPAWLPERALIREEITWARRAHEARGTRLVESSSWWFVGEDWGQRLHKVLESAGATIPPADWPVVLARMRGNEHAARVEQSLRWFLQTTARYIQLLSEGGHDAAEIFSRAGGAPDARRIRLFKQVCAPVWTAYQRSKEEKGRIDFSDMIRLSREALATGRWRRGFTHIIVDEFQDVSKSKLELLQALRAQTPGSSLTCVGDDWQAINRFAGGDLGLMTGFASHVGGKPWETRLDATFRFNQAIAEVSGWFVQNNPAQIAKTLRSPLAIEGDEVVSMHAPHTSSDDFRPILLALDEIDRRAASGATVCILGRYRRLLGSGEETAAALGRRYPRLTISLSTVHQYKGKEADWVVVGWLTDDRLGFPCLRHDDPIIAELLPKSEQYPLAEERRLFYVALTRARRGVYLVCDEAKPSPFVIEIERTWAAKGRVKVLNLGKAPNLPCPSCRTGALVPRSGPHGLFYACQNAPACTYREPSCPACGVGLMIPEGELLTCSAEGCGHQVRKCPRCGTGRLVPRRNRATGESFLGCSAFADEAVRCGFTERG